MLKKLVYLLLVAFVSFIGFEIFNHWFGKGIGIDVLNVVQILGTVIICCTYIILSKINELKKLYSLQQNTTSEN